MHPIPTGQKMPAGLSILVSSTDPGHHLPWAGASYGLTQQDSLLGFQQILDDEILEEMTPSIVLGPADADVKEVTKPGNSFGCQTVKETEEIVQDTSVEQIELVPDHPEKPGAELTSSIRRITNPDVSTSPKSASTHGPDPAEKPNTQQPEKAVQTVETPDRPAALPTDTPQTAARSLMDPGAHQRETMKPDPGMGDRTTPVVQAGQIATLPAETTPYRAKQGIRPSLPEQNKIASVTQSVSNQETRQQMAQEHPQPGFTPQEPKAAVPQIKMTDQNRNLPQTQRPRTIGETPLVRPLPPLPRLQSGTPADPIVKIPASMNLPSGLLPEPAVLAVEPLASAPPDLLPSQVSPHDPFPIRRDLPLHIARQFAEVAQSLPSRPVDIVLNPEELGRVRLSMSPSEHSIVVHVLVERPDTLDLMRRHIEQLEQEFQNLGFKEISLSFSSAEQGTSDSDGRADDGNNPQQMPHHRTDDVAQTTEIHLSSGSKSGLDLRL